LAYLQHHTSTTTSTNNNTATTSTRTRAMGGSAQTSPLPVSSSAESKESRVRRHVEAEASRLGVNYRHLVEVIIENLVYSPVGSASRQELQSEISMLFDRNRGAWFEEGGAQ